MNKHYVMYSYTCVFTIVGEKLIYKCSTKCYMVIHVELEYRRLGELYYKRVPSELVQKAKRLAIVRGHPDITNPFLYIDSTLAWLQVMLGGTSVLIRPVE